MQDLKKKRDALLMYFLKNNKKFNIKTKDKSLFMKVLSKILFFNKDFMTSVTTTIGNTVYFPSDQYFNEHPKRTLRILCHEWMHVLDNKNDRLFKIKYLFPQILSVFSLFAILSFLSPWFMLFLGFLIFLLPWRAPWRTYYEARGYRANLHVDFVLGDHQHLFNLTSIDYFYLHIHNFWNIFSGWKYYRMFSGLRKAENLYLSKEYIEWQEIMNVDLEPYRYIDEILND